MKALLISYLAIQISILAQVSTTVHQMVEFNFGSAESFKQGWNQYDSAHLLNGLPSDIPLASTTANTNTYVVIKSSEDESAPIAYDKSIISEDPLNLNSAAPIVTSMALAAPTKIQFDFGNTASPTGWNQYNDSTGLIGPVTDSTGASSTVSIGISNSPANNDTSFLDGSSQGGSGDSSVYNDALTLTGNGNDTFTIIISGLDPLLSYNIFTGGLSTDDSFGADWTIGGTTEKTEHQNDFGYVSFSAIIPDSFGNITLVVDDLVNGNANNNPGTGIGIAELTITLVPEPSATLLLGIGGLYLSMRRKRPSSSKNRHKKAPRG